MAQTEFYTVQDSDVNVFHGYILSLTEQGEQNIRDTSIIIPETLDGQKVVGIYDNNEGVFAQKNLQYVKLPKTIEYIGHSTFVYNNGMLLCNLNELINLRHIGALAFGGIKGIDNPTNPHRLDFSNLSKLEKIGFLAFGLHGIDENYFYNTVDFTNCTKLKSIGALAFDGIAEYKEDKTLDSLIFKNCTNLSYIGTACFSSFILDSTLQENINQKHIDFSDCKSLLYLGGQMLGYGVNNFSYIEDLLPTPQIDSLTFNSWRKNCGYGSTSYLALFDEYVISIDDIRSNTHWKKSTPQTRQEMLTALNQQKNTKDSVKKVSFSIQSHSVGEVTITNIHCNLSHCTLSWTSGTIASGATQEVTVTYPDTTTNFTATITIEGENLMGNTTVFIDDKGGVTTDDNLITAIAPHPNALQHEEIKLFPNPATNLLNIEFSKKQVANEVTIVNLQGETVYENLNFEGSAIDISGLPLGVYVVKVNGNAKIFVKN